MSKKRNKPTKGNVVWHQSPEEATLSKMPKYNGYAVGHGPHGEAKYNRAKTKAMLKRDLSEDGG